MQCMEIKIDKTHIKNYKWLNKIMFTSEKNYRIIL